MNLFIGNLPSTANEHDLSALLGLSQAEVARRVRIFKRTDREGHIQRYGVVHVEKDADLRKLLSRHRHAKLDGQSLNVREFVPRASGNERRDLNWRARVWPHLERRKTERRGRA